MSKLLKTNGMNKCTGCFTCMLVCSTVNQKNHSFEKSAIRIKTTGGVKGQFYATVCRGCSDNIACLNACQFGALTARAGGGVKLDLSKCIGCKKCVQSCSIMAVSFNKDENKPIICKHCGICAQYCPHNCITFEER